MNVTRANFLSDERFSSLRPALQEHLGKISKGITPENFLSLCDDLVLSLLHEAFRQVGADEGSIWLLNPEKSHLVITYNNGPDADKITGFQQPLSEGIVSMVAATEHAFAESEVYKNKKHSATLDRQLGKTTFAMIAVPFYLLGAVRGVISCVQLINVRFEGDQALPTDAAPAGFKVGDMGVVHRTATVIRDLLDYRLLKTAIGWQGH